MTAFFGTACGKAMNAARRDTMSALYSSGTATLHAISHWRQPVQAAASTNLGFWRTLAW